MTTKAKSKKAKTKSRKKTSVAKTKKISISTDTAELAWMEHYAKKHSFSLSHVFTSAARLFRHFTVDQPARVKAAMKGCGNPSHYADVEEPVPEDAVLLKADPLPTPTWELSAEERSAFMLVSLYVPKTEEPKDIARLEELLTGHESRDLFRRACEKLLARADSRQVLTSPERELAYLKERVNDAKGWLRLGLTHELWGSIVDGYAALDNGRVPPVKTWKAPVQMCITCTTSHPITEAHTTPGRQIPGSPRPVGCSCGCHTTNSGVTGHDCCALARTPPPSNFSPDFSEGGGVEKQAPLPPSVSRGSCEDDQTRDELKKPLGRGGME